MDESAKDQGFMDMREFRDFGYLQEANRVFFHPLGLCLGVMVDSDDPDWSKAELVVRDLRNVPDGVFFYEKVISKEKIERVWCEWRKRSQKRSKKVGRPIQPADG